MKKTIRKTHAITLIALIITIIVMLILVSVSITMAINGGLFKYAGDAVRDTKTKMAEEQEWANGDIVDYYLNRKSAVVDLPDYKTATEYKKDEDGFALENLKYESGYAMAVIPKGFKVSDVSGEQTIAEGLVIQDEEGNEFVWVPVNEEEFNRTEWEDNAPTETFDDIYTEEVPQDLIDSIEKYGGFYIGRYEAGYSEGRTSSNNASTAKPLSKKNIYPYNYITWTDAKSRSQEMYADDNYGVVSTLCYGVEWDAVLRFIKDIFNVTDSTSWGNYTASENFTFIGEYYTSSDDSWKSDVSTKGNGESKLLQTGASEHNKAKNIYDLAGNVGDWTMEPTSRNGRIFRGGDFEVGGASDAASDRHAFNTTNGVCGIGFRVALYIS